MPTEISKAGRMPCVCDALMIGRGAVGNPWIFESIKSYMDKKDVRCVSREERAQMAKRHLRMMCAHLGESRAVPEARKAVCAYFTDFPGAAAARAEINCAASAEAMCGIIDKLLT